MFILYISLIFWELIGIMAIIGLIMMIKEWNKYENNRFISKNSE